MNGESQTDWPNEPAKIEPTQNYRSFMQEGALPGFLADLPQEKICWQPAFHGSMALVNITLDTP
jgi:hypothetical protein